MVVALVVYTIEITSGPRRRSMSANPRPDRPAQLSTVSNSISSLRNNRTYNPLRPGSKHLSRH